MPYSDPALRPWITDQLVQRGAAKFTHAVDIGCGDGSAVDTYRPIMPNAHWTGIEIWEPYDARFGLRKKYGALIIGDARQEYIAPCDVCFFGDVLEHMLEVEAKLLWRRARQSAKWLVIGIPIVDMPQGEWEGNPYEAHITSWDVEKVLASFAGIESWIVGQYVGAFIAAGEGE